MSDGVAGLEHVRAEIVRACKDARRDAASVTLVAVSKTFGAEAIEPVIAAGQRVFGENRVQEAKAKWPPLTAKYGDLPPPKRGRVGEGVQDRPPPGLLRKPTSPLQGEVKKN